METTEIERLQEPPWDPALEKRMETLEAVLACPVLCSHHKNPLERR